MAAARPARLTRVRLAHWTRARVVIGGCRVQNAQQTVERIRTAAQNEYATLMRRAQEAEQARTQAEQALAELQERVGDTTAAQQREQATLASAQQQAQSALAEAHAATQRAEDEAAQLRAHLDEQERVRVRPVRTDDGARGGEPGRSPRRLRLHPHGPPRRVARFGPVVLRRLGIK